MNGRCQGRHLKRHILSNVSLHLAQAEPLDCQQQLWMKKESVPCLRTAPTTSQLLPPSFYTQSEFPWYISLPIRMQYKIWEGGIKNSVCPLRQSWPSQSSALASPQRPFTLSRCRTHERWCLTQINSLDAQRTWAQRKEKEKWKDVERKMTSFICAIVTRHLRQQAGMSYTWVSRRLDRNAWRNR